MLDSGRVGLSPDYLDNLAELTRIAAATGIYLILTSNDIPDGGGRTAIGAGWFVGTLARRETVLADRKALGDDRRNWYHLVTDAWGRSDIVGTEGPCAGLPLRR